MISNKKVIALTVVLFVLIGVILAIGFWPSNDGETSGKIVIFETEKDTIKQMEVHLNFASFKKGENGWVALDDESIKLKQSAVDELAFEFSSIMAEEKVENPLSDNHYGFDVPSAMMNLYYGDEAVTFIIGNKTPIGNMHYFKMYDDENVYTISGDKAHKFMQKLEVYRDKTIMSITPEEMSGILINDNGKKIMLDKDDDGLWDIEYPDDIKSDSKKIEDTIVSPLSYLTVLEFVEGDDYTACGLSPEIRTVTVKDKSGKSTKLVVGNRRDNGDYYIKSDKSKEIYIVEGGSLDFIELDVYDFADKSIVDVELSEFSKAVVKTADATYTLTSENGVYKINGIEIMKSEFEKMYEAMSSLTAASHHTAYINGNADITIDYTEKDGDREKIEFLSIDDGTYAAKIDGECEYKIAKSEVEKIVNSIKALVK